MSQTIEWIGPSGVGQTLKLFAVGSDTVIESQAGTEATNRKGRWSATFTTNNAGRHTTTLVRTSDGAGLAAFEGVYLAGAGGTTLCVDEVKADVRQFGGTDGAFAAGRPEANASHIAGSPIQQSGGRVEANVTRWKSATPADLTDTDKVSVSVQHMATAITNAIRNAITGGAYGLDTDANGRVRIVDGTGPGEIDTASGKVSIVSSDISLIQSGLSTLTQADIRSAVGLATANLDAQLSAIIAEVDNRSTVILDTTVATVNSQTSFVLTAGPTFDTAFKAADVVFYDVSNSNYPSVTQANAYTGSTKTLTLQFAPAFTVVAGDKVRLFVNTAIKSNSATQVAQLGGDSKLIVKVTGSGDIAAGALASGAIASTTFAANALDAVWSTATRTLTAFSFTPSVNLTQWRGNTPGNLDANGFVPSNITAVNGNTTRATTLADSLDVGQIASQASVDVIDSIVDAILDDTGTSGVIVNAAGLQTDAVNEIRNSITGGGYALSTDALGRVRHVVGTGAGEFDSAGGRLQITEAQIDQIVAEAVASAIGTNLSTLITRVPDVLSLANINAEMDDVMAVDTHPQPGQGNWPATASYRDMLRYGYKQARNKKTQLASGEQQIFDDAGTTVDHKAMVTEVAGVSTTIGKFVSGP